MMTEEQFAKLPRYAQQEIARLRYDNADLKETLHQIDAGTTDTKIVDYINGDRGLPEGTQVKFIGDGKDNTVTVSVDNYGRITAHSSTGALAFYPHSSNMAFIRAHGHFSDETRVRR